jgi:hypothetical protein
MGAELSFQLPESVRFGPTKQGCRRTHATPRRADPRSQSLADTEAAIASLNITNTQTIGPTHAPHFPPHFRARRSLGDRKRLVFMRGLTRPDARRCHPAKARSDTTAEKQQGWFWWLGRRGRWSADYDGAHRVAVNAAVTVCLGATVSVAAAPGCWTGTPAGWPRWSART